MPSLARPLVVMNICADCISLHRLCTRFFAHFLALPCLYIVPARSFASCHLDRGGWHAHAFLPICHTPPAFLALLHVCSPFFTIHVPVAAIQPQPPLLARLVTSSAFVAESGLQRAQHRCSQHQCQAALHWQWRKRRLGPVAGGPVAAAQQTVQKVPDQHAAQHHCRKDTELCCHQLLQLLCGCSRVPGVLDILHTGLLIAGGKHVAAWQRGPTLPWDLHGETLAIRVYRAPGQRSRSWRGLAWQALPGNCNTEVTTGRFAMLCSKA